MFSYKWEGKIQEDEEVRMFTINWLFLKNGIILKVCSLKLGVVLKTFEKYRY